MNNKYICSCLTLLIICFLVMPITGCSKTSNTTTSSSSVKGTSVTSSKSTAKSASAKPTDKSTDKFSAAFKKLDKNPLNEDIQYMLWITATSKDTTSGSSGQSSTTPLMSLADKFKKLVDSQGVHYTENSEVLGIKLTTEYWLKNGKFKIADNILNEVTLFDGQYYIKYKTDEKTGNRFKKDAPFVSTDVSTKAYGMIANLAKAPYQQKEDQRFESFDCSVFFMDIELMGMKGNTLWVDKNTGMLVKNSSGDAKQGMTTYVSKLETGGFKDDVFIVPADIKLVDY